MTTAVTPLYILLVEDSKTDAILIQRAVQLAMPSHCTIKRVENLEAALSLVTEETFDVVLLDLSLPDATGFDGLLRIQNMAPKLPVIILTAHADEELSLQAVQHGAQDYLFKDRADGNAIKRAMHYAIKRKQFEAVLIMRANFDPLTGLANRQLFESRLETSMARNQRMSGGIGIFFLDLDKFKQVNDTLGHAAGDSLLKQWSERLKLSVRSYDTAARFGGDEFAVMIDGVENREDCMIVAEKIVQIATEPFLLNSIPTEIGVSIGITTCMPGETLSAAELIKQADTAMYEAKIAAGSGYRFYTSSIA